jgi:MFS family permease
MPSDFRALLRGPLRTYYLTTIFGCIGLGLTLSLEVIYVHDIRHFSIAFATYLLAVNAVVALGTTPLIGSLTDRFGPIKVLLTCSVALGISLFVWSVSTSEIVIIVMSNVLAAFSSGTWGPSSVLLTRMIAFEHRQRAYGTNFMLVNLGIAIGGLISASVVNLHRPITFEHLYQGMGVVEILTVIPLLTLRRFGGPVPNDEEHMPAGPGGWTQVLKDRRMIHYLCAAIVLLVAGYGSLEAGFSLFVVQNVHLPVRAIGVVFFFNTVTIVVAQLFVLRLIEGRSRTRVMAGVGLLWGLSWIVIGLSAQTPHWLALAFLCFAQMIFALGETLLSPVAPAIVNDIAPEHLRGRYNAASGLTWSLGGTVAPLFAGLVLGGHLAQFWPLMVAGGAFAGGLFALSLRRSLTPQEDGLSPFVSS